MNRTRGWVLPFVLFLVPAYADDKYGVIEFGPTPEEVSVYIEGFFSGRTPVRVPDVPEGAYRVVVKSALHGDYIEDIVVEKVKTTTVSATLPEGGYRSPLRADEDYAPVVGKEARKPYEKATSVKKLRGYRVLEIANFLVKSEEPLAPEYLYSIFHDLSEQLDKKTKFETFVTNYTRGPSERWMASEGPEAPTLVLSGVITEYQAGSKAKRIFGGLRCRENTRLLFVPARRQSDGRSGAREDGERFRVDGSIRREQLGCDERARRGYR